MPQEMNEDIFQTIDKKYPDDYKKHDELYRKAVANKYKEQDDAEERESDNLSHEKWAKKRFSTKNISGTNKTRSRKIKKLRKEIDKMQDALESLENLNVSEECFNDIMEDIETYIKKKYPEEEKFEGSHSSPANKTTELLQKSRQAAVKELVDAENREGKTKVLDKRYKTKRGQGEIKTLLKQKGLSEELVEEINLILEDLINELKDETVNSFVSKRKENYAQAQQNRKRAENRELKLDADPNASSKEQFDAMSDSHHARKMERYAKAKAEKANALKGRRLLRKVNKEFKRQEEAKQQEDLKKKKEEMNKPSILSRIFGKKKSSPIGLSGLREDLLEEIMGIVEALLLNENDRKHLNDFKNASPDLNKKIYYEGPKVEYKPKTNEDPKEVIKDLGLVNASILKKKENT